MFGVLITFATSTLNHWYMKKFYAVFLLFAILSIVDLRLQAQTFKLLKDINTLTPSLPTNFTRTSSEYAILNGKAYFTADDGIHGQELWVSDGTLPGTKMVKDIVPGPEGSLVSSIFTYKNKIYFFVSALEGSYKSTLYASDGTASGTVMIKDNFGLMAYNSSAPSFIVMNDILYFTASGSYYFEELWRTDGTTAGTVKLINVNTPDLYYQFDIKNLTVFNNKLFFSTSGFSQYLWSTDGTPEGTKEFTYLSYHQESFSSIDQLSVVNNTLFVLANNSLWMTQGDSISSKRLTTSSTAYITGMKIYKQDVLLAAKNNITSISGIFRYNPQATNNLSLSISLPAIPAFGPAIQDNLLFFTAPPTPQILTPYLWVFDGNASTYNLLLANKKDFNNFYVADNYAYFSHNGNDKGEEFWVSDGTIAGTRMLDDINTGIYNSSPSHFTKVDNYVFFAANSNDKGIELYRTNISNTMLVKDINTSSTSASTPSITPGQYDTINNKLFFWANDEIHGFEPWTTDGTEAGTTLMKDIAPGPASGNGYVMVSPGAFSGIQLLPVNNRLNGYDYFFGSSATNGWALYKTKGTTASTAFVTNFVTTPNGIKPEGIAVVNNKIFTVVNVDGSSQLYVYDGVTEPQLLKTGFSLVSPVPDGKNMLGDGHNLYFFVDLNPEIELWKSDGTVAGTMVVKNLYPGQANRSQTCEMVNYNGQVFFTACSQYPNEYKWYLWKTDGSTDGTARVGNAEGTARPLGMFEFNKKLYFAGHEDATGNELWVTDGTNAGTHLFKDIEPGANGSDPSNFINFKDKLYFLAANNSMYGIWKTDGTDTGTTVVAKNSYNLVDGDGKLYYVSGNKIWQSDGTTAGSKSMDTTSLAGVSPYNLLYANNRLYFEAITYKYGLELYTTADKLLPVTLLNFSAQLRDKDALLQWSTVNEQNNSYFNVQRSINGTSFTNISRVDAKNAVKRNDYDYTDAGVTALGAEKLYYRLQQFDADGKFTYSKTIALTINSKTLVTIGPNPATDIANIFSTVNMPNAVVSITDMGGRVLYTAKQNIVAGSKTSVPLQGFAKGVYTVTIQAANAARQEFKLVIGK